MAKDKSKKNAYIDVMCTEFVIDKDGYKAKKAEYPRRFPAEIWERIRVNKYTNKEFRLMTQDELIYYERVPAVKDVKPINTEKVLDKSEQAEKKPEPKPFIPKSHKEILLMNKAELIEYCVAKYKTDPKLYEGMKNKELQAEAEKQ